MCFLSLRASCLDKLRRIAPLPRVPKDFAPSQFAQVMGELAASQRAMRALMLILTQPRFTRNLASFLLFFAAKLWGFSKLLLPGTSLFKTCQILSGSAESSTAENEDLTSKLDHLKSDSVT